MAHAIELLHGISAEDDLPDPNGTALGESHGELGPILGTVLAPLVRVGSYVGALCTFLV